MNGMVHEPTRMVFGAVGLLVLAAVASAAEPATPESRALGFLVKHVPRWSPENKCFSCHNNGDAARALYAAVRLKRDVPDDALADTSAWLAQPTRWDKNGGDGPFSDKKLARIQFAAALVAALDAGLVKEAAPLQKAADLVAEHQEKDGSWQVEAEGSIGSPITYGAALATHLARHTLYRADPERYRAALAGADRWFRTAPVKTVLDAAAVLLALDGATDAHAGKQQRHCLELIRKGQSHDGGWGPFVTSPPEVFDTALVVLALSRYPREDGASDRVRRGRAFLIGQQHKDGGWPETTRPPGTESYAQRLSTTGWATLALLATAQLKTSTERERRGE